MAIPNYGKLITTMKLMTSARNIATMLKAGRSYAVTQRAIYRVVFDTTVTPNLIYITDNAGVQVGNIYALSGELNIPGITFELDADGKRKASFKSTGALTDETVPDRSVWIRKANATSYQTSPLNFKRINVISITGKVTIDETPGP